jgi:hypothetical protein
MLHRFSKNGPFLVFESSDSAKVNSAAIISFSFMSPTENDFSTTYEQIGSTPSSAKCPFNLPLTSCVLAGDTG